IVAVLQEGTRARTKFLDVRAIASPLPHLRVGLVVPKRSQTAIDRNRVKRRLRELVRLYVLPASDSMDVVIRTRDEAYAASFAQLQTDLVKSVERLRQAFQKTE
ncbi:MAG: ribonuclease P protein component, partial [Anaerolineae bacterium]|nr:ribonuclease P protein component [Gemmatimonadaceae bacterium]